MQLASPCSQSRLTVNCADSVKHAWVLLLQDLSNEAAGKPLQPKQLAQALGVAQALADVLGASGGGATAGKAALSKSGAQLGSGQAGVKQAAVVLVPDESGVMRAAADLAFDDAPWLDGPNTGKQVTAPPAA